MSNRRNFIKKSGIILGGSLLSQKNYPNEDWAIGIPGKHPDLVILNDRPINVETPPHLLDPEVTPADVLFVRNNGIPQSRSEISISNWILTIDGESASGSKSYSIADLKNKFETVQLQLTLECGGNGRAEFVPAAKGNQWTTGAVGCPLFEGVRLKDVLNDVGVQNDAVYIGYYGSDKHLSGDASKRPISRGVPISKAMEPESLIAWNMNGKPLPMLNGYPLRLVIGGWPGSCSGKWLNRISIRNKVHDGPKMTGTSYKVPCKTVGPGDKVAVSDMCIIESMPVKSLITYPKTGATVTTNQTFEIRGHAWAGDHEVRQVQWSTDFGATWKSCTLKKPVNRHAWQRFTAAIQLQKVGYYEIWAKATDNNGVSQPMVVPGWNPKGYLNNACHRIAIKVI